MAPNNDNFGCFSCLKGLENWEVWSIRMRALLVREKLIISINLIQNPPIPPLANADEVEIEKYNNLNS